MQENTSGSKSAKSRKTASERRGAKTSKLADYEDPKISILAGDWNEVPWGVGRELAQYAQALEVTGEPVAAAILVLATRIRHTPELLSHELLKEGSLRVSGSVDTGGDLS